MCLMAFSSSLYSFWMTSSAHSILCASASISFLHSASCFSSAALLQQDDSCFSVLGFVSLVLPLLDELDAGWLDVALDGLDALQLLLSGSYSSLLGDLSCSASLMSLQYVRPMSFSSRPRWPCTQLVSRAPWHIDRVALVLLTELQPRCTRSAWRWLHYGLVGRR